MAILGNKPWLGKVQHDLGIFCCVKNLRSTIQIMTPDKKRHRSQLKEAPTYKIWDNLNVKILNITEL